MLLHVLTNITLVLVAILIKIPLQTVNDKSVSSLKCLDVSLPPIWFQNR